MYLQIKKTSATLGLQVFFVKKILYLQKNVFHPILKNCPIHKKASAKGGLETGADRET